MAVGDLVQFKSPPYAIGLVTKSASGGPFTQSKNEVWVWFFASKHANYSDFWRNVGQKPRRCWKSDFRVISKAATPKKAKLWKNKARK